MPTVAAAFMLYAALKNALLFLVPGRVNVCDEIPNTFPIEPFSMAEISSQT